MEMLKLIGGHQGTVISESALTYLLVYTARYNADGGVGSLISNKAPETLALRY